MNTVMTDEKQPIEHIEEQPIASPDARAPEILEQLRTENEQLKQTIRLSQAHRQITGELAKAGARSPELLFTSIRSDLQFSPDGKLENAAALVARLKTSFPEQFGKDPVSIDAGSGTSVPDALSASSLEKMTANEIARLNWDDVKRVLSS